VTSGDDESLWSGLCIGGLLALALAIFCCGGAKAMAGAAEAAIAPKPTAGPAAAKAGGGAKSPAVAVSSAAPAGPGVNDLYPLDKMHLRDPFAQLGGGSGGYSGEPGSGTGEFSIHNLILKGIMKDSYGDFALFVDGSSGANYVLRKDILYNMKRKPVRGVSGIIKPQLKTVHLLTLDKDVQTFILGEERGAE